MRQITISGPICTYAGLIEGNLTLNAGEVVLLCGENGIGKSSFIQFIKLNPQLRDKNQCSFSDQLPLRSVNTIKVKTFLEMLSHDFKNFNYDFKNELLIEILEKSINDLSGGENQILKLIVALSFDSDFYILDEPSTYLDEQKVSTVKKLISEKRKSSKTVLIVEHRSQLFEDIIDRKIKIEKAQEGLVLNEL